MVTAALLWAVSARAALSAAPADLDRARSLAWAGRYAEAVASYEAILRYAPDDKEAAAERAELLGLAGRRLESERLLKDIAGEDRVDAGVRLALGELHLWGGDRSQSRRFFGEALALAEGSPRALDGLVQLDTARRPSALLRPIPFSNSSGYARQATRAELSWPAADNWTATALYSRVRHSQRGEDALAADAAGARLNGQLGMRWSLWGELQAASYERGGPTLGGGARAGFLARDTTHLSGSFVRAETYGGAPRELIGPFDLSGTESVRARARLDDWSATALELRERFYALADVHYGVYGGGDGGNRKLSATAQAIAVVRGTSQEGLESGYQLLLFDARRPSPLYFSPGGYVSHGWVVKLSAALGVGLRLRLSNNLFYQPDGRRFGASPQLSLSCRLGRVEAAAEGSYATSDVRGRSAFESRQASASLRWRF